METYPHRLKDVTAAKSASTGKREHLCKQVFYVY